MRISFHGGNRGMAEEFLNGPEIDISPLGAMNPAFHMEINGIPCRLIEINVRTTYISI